MHEDHINLFLCGDVMTGRGIDQVLPHPVTSDARYILLQAAVLGLGATVVGAFDDAAVVDVLGLPDFEHPLYLLPVGWPADNG